MKQKKVFGLSIVLTITVMLLIGFFAFRQFDENNLEESPNTLEEDLEDDLNTAEEDLEDGLNTAEEDLGDELNTTEKDLGDGLKLVRLYNETARYVEDGSDEMVENCAAAVIQNTSDKTLQYVEITITLDDEAYEFHLTTLPPQMKVCVQELNRKSIPDKYEKLDCSLKKVAFFSEEPSLYEEQFELITKDGEVTIKNLTDTEKTPVYVYYKNIDGEEYRGGITYRVYIDSLNANESKTVAVNHFDEGTSEVMFIQYGEQ